MNFRLDYSAKEKKKTTPPPSKCVYIHNKRVVFTGKIPGMTREEATFRATKLGATVHSIVNTGTDYLIASSLEGASKKFKDAQTCGTKIVLYRDVKNLIQTN